MSSIVRQKTHKDKISLLFYFQKDEISPLHFVSVEMTQFRFTISNLVTSSVVEKSNRIK